MIAEMAKKRPTRRKTAAKTPEMVVPVPELPSVLVSMVEQAHGGALQRGNPGNSGGGRPKNEIRAICEQALEDCRGIEVVKRIASGDIMEMINTPEGPIVGETKNKDRLTAVSLLLDRAYGKAPQEIKMSGNGANGDESGEVVMQRLMAMIGRALLAAPAAQRLAVINEIERAEVSSVSRESPT